MSELHREEALAHLGAVVQHSGDAVIGQALDGTILVWNEGAEQLFGYPEAEAVGRPIWIIVAPEHHQEAERVFDRARRGERVLHHEAVRAARGGQAVEVSLTLSPILQPDGSTAGICTIGRDISAQRRTAAALNDTIARLEAAEEEAVAVEDRSRRFVADAAHQLRRPVAGIQACAETLLFGADQPELDRLLTNMVRETGRAARLVTSLLKVARLDQGEALSPGPCDIVALCCDEADRLWSVAPQIDIVFRTSPLPEVPVLDAAAVREVLANLLDNARRHAVDRIEVTVRPDQAGGVEIRLSDDGPGVAPHLAERIFDRFESLDGEGGTGLGLPIARGLAEAHGGQLTYDGDAFVLRLPMRPRPPVAPR